MKTSCAAPCWNAGRDGHAPLAIGFQRDKGVLRYNRRFAECFGFDGDSGWAWPRRPVSVRAGRNVVRQAAPCCGAAAVPGRDGDAPPRRLHVLGVAYGYVMNPGKPADRALRDTIWLFDDRSAQKAAEEATRQLMLEQQAILDNASVGILFSRSRLILRCNPRFAEMFGYTQDEMIGLPAAELFPSPAAYEAFGVQATPLLGQGLPYEQDESLFRRRDGSLFWCRIRAKAVDQTHSEQGAIWILEDITASRQAQMEVAAIMTNASVSILYTKNRQITRYNLGFAAMFGYSGDEALGCRRARVRVAAIVLIYWGAPRFLPVRRKPFQTEVEMMRRDGQHAVGAADRLCRQPDDPAARHHLIIEDRTEPSAPKNPAQRAAGKPGHPRQRRAGYFGDRRAATICAPTARWKSCSLWACEINGLSVRACIRTWPRGVARGETARDFEAGRVHMSEYQLVRKDGSRFWARLSGRPFDLAHAHGRSVWLVDDVTARREAAEAVRRARDELELRVQERTAELAGANLLLQGEIAERRQAEARVHHMAYHDNLTGLPNRALLSDRLERSMLASQRSERKLAVMFIDLDRFKTINDSLGHMTGDLLLKEVAARLCGAVRASDTVARLGGDEFVVLVPGIRGGDEAARVAEKIIEALTPAFPLDGHVLHVTPSIGICVYPDDGGDVDALMRHADAAMYHAKGNGRNNYQFFTQTMNQAAALHFDLESSLRTALALQQFELVYQPVIDIATRRLHGMEVLLRWRRPGHGLVLPDRFIPIMEENGLIVPVGEWVMRQACEQSMAWQRQGLQPVPLAVNLSPRQFMHKGLVAAIGDVVADTGIDPSLLEFEITETALMQHGEHTLEFCGRSMAWACACRSTISAPAIPASLT